MWIAALDKDLNKGIVFEQSYLTMGLALELDKPL
jgi:hypothetical protein